MHHWPFDNEIFEQFGVLIAIEINFPLYRKCFRMTIFFSSPYSRSFDSPTRAVLQMGSPDFAKTTIIGFGVVKCWQELLPSTHWPRQTVSLQGVSSVCKRLSTNISRGELWEDTPLSAASTMDRVRSIMAKLLHRLNIAEAWWYRLHDSIWSV